MYTSLFRILFLFYIAGIFSACSAPPQLKKVERSMLELNAQSPVDSLTMNTITPYKKELDQIMNEVLGVSEQPLLKGLPESTLGDFVSDAVLKKTNDVYQPADQAKADICLLNNGGLRSQLPKGNITRGNIFELMPFENSIVILTLSPEKTKQLFETLVQNNGAPFAGATVTAKGKKLNKVLIGGKEFDANRNYKVVTSDYLASGGDKYLFFKDPVRVDTLDYKLRDAIIDHIRDETKKGNTLKVELDGRIRYE